MFFLNGDESPRTFDHRMLVFVVGSALGSCFHERRAETSVRSYGD